MKLMMKVSLVLMLAVILCPVTTAQVLPENHYKVYDVSPPANWGASIFLHDQFGDYFVQWLTLTGFATPVMKNDEPILFPLAHQTWWSVDFPTPGWNVAVENQFGFYSWHVGDARFLVLPAYKYEPGPPLLRNHYLAYEASGPRLDLPVVLADQFGSVTVLVTEPELFLNPVEKVVDGVVYPIIDDEVHLACYRIEPPVTSGIGVVAFDQFGTWSFTLGEHHWLCVPSLKREVVQTDRTTWGAIKTLYHR